MEGDFNCFFGNFRVHHFNPLPPHGGRRRCAAQRLAAAHFNPLPPHGGRLSLTAIRSDRKCISIHSLRMEGDRYMNVGGDPNMQFQSTPSAWRETHCPERCRCRCGISIHSLRMEGDSNRFYVFGGKDISIHSLRMEGDGDYFISCDYGTLFQSTPSAWRETMGHDVSRMTMEISIHSLRMEGDIMTAEKIHRAEDFNPLPPHGGRRRCQCSSGNLSAFQSTPSAWRETRRTIRQVRGEEISIHSLRMEGDYGASAGLQDYLHFNPLPPHGGRLMEVQQ